MERIIHSNLWLLQGTNRYIFLKMVVITIWIKCTLGQLYLQLGLRIDRVLVALLVYIIVTCQPLMLALIQDLRGL